MYRQLLQGMLVTIGLCLSLVASAQEPAAAPAVKTTFQEGEDYTVIATPVKTAKPDKIEVTEVFWYGCSHCYDFEDLLEPWVKKLPSDVNFVRSPAIWRDDPMRIHAKLYFTVLQLNLVDKAHGAIFDAIHKDHKRLDKESEIVDFLQQFGAKPDEITATLNSFSVDSMASLADSRAKSYGVTGTPQMVVNGKYLVTGQKSGGQAGMLRVVDYLIQKERAARKK